MYQTLEEESGIRATTTLQAQKGGMVPWERRSGNLPRLRKKYRVQRAYEGHAFAADVMGGAQSWLG